MERSEINNVLAAIVDTFVVAMTDDMLPHEEIGSIFGVHSEAGRWGNDLASSEMGLVMFGLWQSLLVQHRVVSANDLKRELLQGTLPEYLERTVRTLPQGCTSKYSAEVLRRGFQSIAWETSMHEVFKTDTVSAAPSINSLPQFIRDYAQSLPAGMYTPFPYPREITPGNIDFVSIVGNVDDSIVRDVADNPTVEIRLGVRTREGKVGAAVVLVWLFLSIEGRSGASHLFEIGFNIGDPDVWEHFSTLSGQPFYEIITCGQTTFTATRVELPSLKSDMARVLALAQRHLDVGWSQEDYMAALKDEWAQHPDIESLVAHFTTPPHRIFEDIL